MLAKPPRGALTLGLLSAGEASRASLTSLDTRVLMPPHRPWLDERASMGICTRHAHATHMPRACHTHAARTPHTYRTHTVHMH